jgi:hypothetical protein
MKEASAMVRIIWRAMQASVLVVMLGATAGIAHGQTTNYSIPVGTGTLSYQEVISTSTCPTGPASGGPPPMGTLTTYEFDDLSYTAPGVSQPFSQTIWYLNSPGGSYGCPAGGWQSAIPLVLPGSGYTISFTPSLSGAGSATIVITPMLTFTAIPAKTYGAAPFTVSASSASTGAITYSVTSGPATISGSTVTITGVGTVVLGASQAAAGNYTAATASTSFTVSAANLTITASSPTVAYGAAVPTITPGYSGFVNGQASASLTTQPTCTTTYTTASAAGSSPSTSCSGAVGANYAISYVSGAVTVNKATPSVTAWPTASSITYGQTLASSTLGVGTASVAGSFGFTTPATAPSAGTASQSVTFTPAVPADYNTVIGSVSVTVNQANLMITASSPTVAYGAAVPTITPNYSGFVNGQTSASLTTQPTCTTTYTTASAPGSSPSTSCSGAVDANYAISYVNGAVTVNKASLTITASSPTVAYGAAVPTITPSYSGFVNGQTSASLTTQPTCATAYTTASAPGSSPSTSCSGAVAANYAISYVNGAVTVNKATPSVTAWPTASSITYGQTLASSMLSGGTASVAGSFVFTTPATAPSAGTASQSVTFTPAVPADYNSVIGSVSVTVSPATPMLTFTAIATQTYGAGPFQVTASSASSGAVTYSLTSGQTSSGTVTSSGMVTLTGAGMVFLTASQAASGNYAATTAAISFVVNPAAPTFSPVAGTYVSAQTVTISDTTSGATIYYTTDGTTPTTTSAIYSAPITVSASETLEAIAIATGSLQSGVGMAAYAINLPAATPTFSPVAGTYTSVQTVTIGDTTSGATIYYTTNGTAPTTSSTVYSAPISVSASQTVKAIAMAPGYSQSAVGSAAYTVNLPVAAPTYVQQCTAYQWGTTESCGLTGVGAGHTLVIGVGGVSPTSGTVTSSSGTPTLAVEDTNLVSVYILANTSAGNITITFTSAANETPFLSVFEYAGTAAAPLDGATSAVSAIWTTGAFSSPNITTTTASDLLLSYCESYAGTTFTVGATPVAWTSRINSSNYYERLIEDGPTTTAGTYYGQCTAASGTSGYDIAVLALKPAGLTAAPAFSPLAGAYTSVQTVTISDATSGATIYYTTNGTAPTISSAVYSSPIVVSSSETLKAIATAAGYTNSPTASATYVINLSKAATPTFSPVAGTYTSVQAVTISDATSGATIYYTTNGSTPTTSSAVYSSPIAVSATETVEAIAIASGYLQSSVGSAAYTINPPAATPTLSPATGTYISTQTVTISDSTSGATIYYTTNGSTPTTGSAVYSSPIAVSATETVKAIAIASGSSQSAVGSAAYTINPTAPFILSLSPPSGPVGTPVTLTGVNFGSTQGASTVTFNGTAATSISLWSATSIVAVVPTGATTGNVVVTVGGVACNGVAFTVALSITTVSLYTGTQYAAYSATLQAAGGQPPYTWSYSGNLPSGLQLSASGAITGTPIWSGTASISAIVSDAAQASANANLSISVTAVSSSPPPGSVAYTYDSQGRVSTATYTTSSGTVTVTYSYDNAGNRTTVVTQ